MSASTRCAVSRKEPLTFLQYLSSSRVGGAETYFLRLADALQSAGHRVIGVTRRGTPLQKLLQERAITTYAWDDRRFDFFSVRRLQNIIRQEKVSCVHAHLPRPCLLASRAVRGMNVPLVGHIHSVRPGVEEYAQVPQLVACAQGVRADLIAQGVPAAKIEVFYYGVSLRAFENALPLTEAKARLSLAPDTFTIGVVAALHPRKGHHLLLEAVSQLASGGVTPHILLVGKGGEENNLRAQAVRLGLEDQVHFLGFWPYVNDALSACDVVALPSFREGLSIAIMEAMAMQRPVVVTDIAGMPELVRDGQTGFLVPPGDVPALKAALQKLLLDVELRKTMALAGQEFVQAHFDDVLCLKATVEFLEACALSFAPRGVRSR